MDHFSFSRAVKQIDDSPSYETVQCPSIVGLNLSRNSSIAQHYAFNVAMGVVVDRDLAGVPLSKWLMQMQAHD